jgi:WD40 repeat protein
MANQEFHVFVSHNSKDKPQVEQIAEHLLEDYGINPWLDIWALPGGVDWYEEIQKALDSCSTCLVVLGEFGWGKFHKEEALKAISCMENSANFRVIPVLLPGAKEEDMLVFADLFDKRERIDFRDNLDNQDEYLRMVAGIKRDIPLRDGRAYLSPTKIRRDAALWDRTKDRSKLYRGASLLEAQQLLQEHATQFNELAVRFLTASASGQRDRTRNIIIGLIVGLVVLAGFLGFALVQRNLAISNAQEALRQKQEAKISADRAENEQKKAEKNAEEAKRQQQQAECNAQQAECNAKERDKERIIAEQQRNEAVRQRNEARLQRDRAELATLAERGSKAVLLAGQPGRESEALITAIETVGQSIETGRSMPPQGMESLVAGVGALRRSYPLQKHNRPLSLAALSPDTRRAVTLDDFGKAWLWEVATGKPIVPLNGHSGVVKWVEFSKDSQTIVTASDDTTAMIWDAKTGALMRPLKGFHTRAVKFATFSFDSKRIVTTSDDKTAIIWDAETGAMMKPLIQHQMAVYSATFSPDNKRVLTLDEQGSGLIWNIEDSGVPVSIGGRLMWASSRSEPNPASFSDKGEQVVIGGALFDSQTGNKLWELQSQEGRILKAAFTKNGWRFIVACTASPYIGTIFLYGQDVKEPIAVLKGHSRRVNFANFSIGAQYILTGGEDRYALLWDSKNGKLVTMLQGHSKDIVSGAISFNGRFIVTASRDTTGRLWDRQGGQYVLAMPAFPPLIPGDSCNDGPGGDYAEFAPDGEQILTFSRRDGQAKLWNTRTGNRINRLILNRYCLPAFSSDGKLIATGVGNNSARVLEQGKPAVSLVGHKEYVTYLTFSHDNQRVLTGSEDGTAKLWDPSNGNFIHTLGPHEGSVRFAAFSPNDKLVATVASEPEVRIWEVSTGKPYAILVGHKSKVFSSIFSPDGTMIVTASLDRTARIWNTETGKQIGHPLEGHEAPIWYAEFSPDGARIITACEDTTARLWDTHSGKLIAKLSGHRDWIVSALFSPDGKRVITASRDGTARLWDGVTGELLGVLVGHDAPVWSAKFSPDGMRVVTASEDGTARIYPATLPEFFSIAGEVLRQQPEFAQVEKYFDGRKQSVSRPRPSLR